MIQQFPRTTVGGVSMPRLLIGTNWLLGWSHTGAAADMGIREKYSKPEDFYPVIRAGSEAEAREDIEISLAALERRAPRLGARSSPMKQDILGH